MLTEGTIKMNEDEQSGVLGLQLDEGTDVASMTRNEPGDSGALRVELADGSVHLIGNEGTVTEEVTG